MLQLAQRQSREHHACARQDPRLFGGVHQPEHRAGSHGPCRARPPEVPQHRQDEAKREKHQQRLMDEVAAVVHHGGRDGGEQCRGRRTRQPQVRNQQEMRRYQQHSDRRRHRTQRGLVQVGIAPDSLRARHHPSQVVQRGAVIIRGGVFVAALFQQDAELVRVDRFIGVHGPRGKLRKTKRRRDRHDRQKYQRSAAAFLQS